MARRPTAIVGCGLIGGSLALALPDSSDFFVSAVFDPALTPADRRRLDHEIRTDGPLVETVADAEVVVVAVPVSSISEVAALVASMVQPGTIITDVGSVKAPVVRAAESWLPEDVSFVGGHPMAGTEQHGFAAASPSLFENASWAITPTSDTSADAVAVVSDMVRAVDATPIYLDADVHDRVVATVSHVPQLIASTLMNVASERSVDSPTVLRLAAGGFRDVTRIAAGSPVMWEDILHENAPMIREVLDHFIDELTKARNELDDREGLRSILAQAEDARRTLPGLAAKAQIHDVVVPVADVPGEFALLTTAIGEAGINIVDLKLRHSPEGGKGLLTVAVVGIDAAHDAVEALAKKGHTAWISEPDLD